MCFALMDEDGSGSIDASEMGGAFKLLNIKMHPREIEELLAEVDPTGAGELDFLEVLPQVRKRGSAGRPAAWSYTRGCLVA
jgi:Ca2+-binding EF-hand superfamily protein